MKKQKRQADGTVRLCPYCKDPAGYRGECCPKCGKDDGNPGVMHGDSSFLIVQDPATFQEKFKDRISLADVKLHELVTLGAAAQVQACVFINAVAVAVKILPSIANQYKAPAMILKNTFLVERGNDYNLLFARQGLPDWIKPALNLAVKMMVSSADDICQAIATIQRNQREICAEDPYDDESEDFHD